MAKKVKIAKKATRAQVSGSRTRGGRKKAPKVGVADDSVVACASALAGRDDLTQYEVHARTLFALQTRFEMSDIHAVAADSLTDGGGDKKCDLVYIDREERFAVVVQSHEAKKVKKEASANKAGELAIAANWLLSEALETLPERIRPRAKELREALAQEAIDTLHFWYVHRSPESPNVENELAMVDRNIRRILREQEWGAARVEVVEVGERRLAEWYHAAKTPIRVSEDFRFDLPGGYEISEQGEKPRWRAAVTSIKLSDLHQIFAEHRDILFSANIRSYLGSRDTDDNINNGIKRSARDAPGDFWAYNNGLTILVNNYTFDANKKGIKVSGMSVVNGAQTTGAIGCLEAAPPDHAMVHVRFIKTQHAEVLEGVVRYNNSQNRVTSADFRSNDKIQRRLCDEFGTHFPELTYQGGRRGGDSDAIGRPKQLIASDTAAQALTAFHEDPALAYFRKGRIWEDQDKYGQVFKDVLTARHLVFVVSLLRAIENYRNDLRVRSGADNLTREEESTLDYFAQRGSMLLLIKAIAECIETICDKKIGDLFHLTFGNVQSFQRMQNFWRPIVLASVPFVKILRHVAMAGLRDADVKNAIDLFSSLISSTKLANAEIYREFTKHVRSA